MKNMKEEIYSLYRQLKKIDIDKKEIQKKIKEKIQTIQKETLPEEYEIKQIVSYYWGSHPEYESSKIATLAIPKNFPEFEVSHGSSGDKEFETLDGEKIPEEKLKQLYIWNFSHELKWEKFNSDLISDPYWEVLEED